jgi:hypothetical protein
MGTALAIAAYGSFALGITSELVLFGVGNVSSLFLIWALVHDRTYYAATLQSTFLVMNTIGIIRILLT